MENITTPEIKTDLRQSKKYGEYIKRIGWTVVGNDPQIFIRKLGFFGSIAKIQRFSNLNWDETKNILRKHGVWMTKLEPLSKLKNFRQDSWPMLATKTLRVDLSGSTEQIKSGFKKDCRYELRKVEKENHAIKMNKFDQFYEIWKLSGKNKNLWIPPKKEFDSLINSFKEDAFCITIDNLAGSLILIHDDVAYYYYSGSLSGGKKTNLPYLVIWECMKEAKKRNCKIWDFEGIYDSRWPNNGWTGFTHFKKSFGGVEIEFPGSFTKWF